MLFDSFISDERIKKNSELLLNKNNKCLFSSLFTLTLIIQKLKTKYHWWNSCHSGFSQTGTCFGHQKGR